MAHPVYVIDHAFPTNEVQNCEAGFINTTNDCDPCSASNLIELDIDPSLTPDLHEADQGKARVSSYQSFKSVQSSLPGRDSV